MNTKTTIFGGMCLVAAIAMGCQEHIVSNKNDKSVPQTSANSSMQTQNDVNPLDGVYAGIKNISGLELSATLTISGSDWSAVSQLDNGSPEYQNGILKNNDLYDDSGLVKIGHVSGQTASIEGYPNMSK